MFDIGFQELALIFIVALLVVGPKELPNIARTLARALRQLQNTIHGIGEEVDLPQPQDTWAPKEPEAPVAPENAPAGQPAAAPARQEVQTDRAPPRGERKLTLIEHLAELRTRLFYCLAGAVVGMIVAWNFYEPWLLDLLKAPLDGLTGNPDNPFVSGTALLRLPIPRQEAASLRLDLHFVGPMEVFVVKLKVALFAGLILASPFIFYHVWAFLAEGLTKTERRAVHLLLPASVVLFLVGLLVSYFVVLPMTLYFLVVITGKGLIPTLILSKYVGLVVSCSLVFGLVFQMPIVILFLTRLGIVTPDFLARNRKYAILVIFVLAGILTPPDVLSQLLMALPMVLLYEISLLVARMPGFARAGERRGTPSEETSLRS